jgi:hypothetical protein
MRGLPVEGVDEPKKNKNKSTYSHEMAFWDVIDPFSLLLTGSGRDLCWRSSQNERIK